MVETFWLLFLFVHKGEKTFEMSDPIGIYESQVSCESDGKRLQETLSRRFSCRPANDAVLTYYSGNCLSDSEQLISKLVRTGICSQLSERLLSEQLRLEVEALRRQLEKK